MTDKDFDRRLQAVEERSEKMKTDVENMRLALGEMGVSLDAIMNAHNALCNLLEGKTMATKPKIITAHQGLRR